jgi:hypothetical protein
LKISEIFGIFLCKFQKNQEKTKKFKKNWKPQNWKKEEEKSLKLSA